MDNNFVILRTAKLTSYGNIAASGEHTFRERPTLNADPERTHLNDNRGAQSAADLVAAVRGRVDLAESAAKQPVLCIEYLITASPEALATKTPAERQAYFDDALRWLEAKHGAANVVCTSLQRDESTEHLAAYVVPLVERQERQRKRSVIVGRGEDGKPIRETRMFTEPGGVVLSAKTFLGGREKLTAMQTEFAAAVGQRHGLQRGVQGSKRVHRRNADIGAMTADRMQLTGQVNALEAEIERLTQQVATGGEAMAKLTARFQQKSEFAQATYMEERAAKNALAEANRQATELRSRVDAQLVELAAAKQAAGVSEGKLAAAVERLSQNGAALAAAQNEVRELKGALAMVTEREKELVEHATAMRAENAGYVATIDELRAVNAVLVEQARQRLAQQPQQAAAQPDQARMERRAPEAQKAPQRASEAPGVAQAPLTLEQAQAAAVRAEEKRTGFRLARHDPRAAEIRAAVRAEWEAAAQAPQQPQQPPEAAQAQQQGRQERQERSIPLQPRPQRTR